MHRLGTLSPTRCLAWRTFLGLLVFLFSNSITKMTDPTTYPIILGRFTSWQYFVRNAEASTRATWETQDGLIHHVWGHQSSPKFILGCCHFQNPVSQPKFTDVIRLLFTEGSIQVEPLTSIKQISRAIRSVKELDNTYETVNKVTWTDAEWFPGQTGNTDG